MKKIVAFNKFGQKFHANEQGNVLILFALGVVFLVAIAGAGVDLGRQQLKTVRLQQAGDAAALSAGSISVSMPGTGSNTQLTNAEITTAANRYFNLNFRQQPDETTPTPTITIAGASPNATLTVDTGFEVMTTSFVNNLGTKTLTSRGLSEVGVAPTQMSDYDVVMVVDESGSEGKCTANGDNWCSSKGEATARPGTRMFAMRDSMIAMTNSIIPAGTNNPNVRLGMVGFSGQITNKWGLSSDNAQVLASLNLLRPVGQNFDHMGMRAGAAMIAGGTAGVANQRIGGNQGDTTVGVNTASPVPRTARTNPSDANGMSPLKYVIFLSDGGIMIEPNAFRIDDDYDPIVAATPGCQNRGPYDAECYKAFLDSCNLVKNTGGTDNVHLIVISFIQKLEDRQGPILSQCASAALPNSAPFNTREKPNPNIDFYYAPTPQVLSNILNNITTQIRSVRLTNVKTN